MVADPEARQAYWVKYELETLGATVFSTRDSIDNGVYIKAGFADGTVIAVYAGPWTTYEQHCLNPGAFGKSYRPDTVANRVRYRISAFNL